MIPTLAALRSQKIHKESMVSAWWVFFDLVTCRGLAQHNAELDPGRASFDIVARGLPGRGTGKSWESRTPHPQKIDTEIDAPEEKQLKSQATPRIRFSRAPCVIPTFAALRSQRIH